MQLRVLLWLLLAPVAFAQYVQSGFNPGPASGFSSALQTCQTNQGAATTLAVTASCNQNVGANHLVFLLVAANNTIGTVTCAGGSLTWTAGHIGGFGYCFTISTTTAALTVTMTSSGAVQQVGFTQEWADSAATFDAASTQTTFGAGTTWTSNSVTTTGTNDLVILWGGNLGTCAGSSSGIFTGAGGWAIPASNGQVGQTGSNCEFMETNVVTTATSYTPSATLSTSNSGFGAAISFKP